MPGTEAWPKYRTTRSVPRASASGGLERQGAD